MRLYQFIHFLHVKQLLGLYFTLKNENVIRIDGDEVGLPDFETSLLTYVLLEGDFYGVVVSDGCRGFYFVQVKAIFTGDKDINFANESFRGGGNEGIEDGRDKGGGFKGGF